MTETIPELTVDSMLIVGKYFESKKDFINIMKVCKKYKELVLMYKFNPISDITLFKNIETQHFYNKEDVRNKKEGKYQYIYWFGDYELMKNKRDNEIFKDVFYNQHIISNIPTLEKWSGLKYHQVLYDSVFDGPSNNSFQSKIMNHSQLYFIVIDENNNVFGHYHHTEIDDKFHGIIDPNIFTFSLYSNGRCGIKKFKTDDGDVATSISDYYTIYSYGFSDCYRISRIGKKDSYIDHDIQYVFDVKDPKVFTGTDEFNYFATKRIIVIEMK